MKIYNKPWNDIPINDRPANGEIYMCLDPQKRLGEKTWSVGIMGDGSLPRDSISLGLFWRENIAFNLLIYFMVIL